jgi:hypothetical protein
MPVIRTPLRPKNPRHHTLHNPSLRLRQGCIDICSKEGRAAALPASNQQMSCAASGDRLSSPSRRIRPSTMFRTVRVTLPGSSASCSSHGNKMILADILEFASIQNSMQLQSTEIRQYGGPIRGDACGCAVVTHVALNLLLFSMPTSVRIAV